MSTEPWQLQIHTGTFLFAGSRVLHYRLDVEEFERMYDGFRPEPVPSRK